VTRTTAQYRPSENCFFLFVEFLHRKRTVGARDRVRSCLFNKRGNVRVTYHSGAFAKPQLPRRSNTIAYFSACARALAYVSVGAGRGHVLGRV
jgi:hypothetical protein